MRRQGVVIAFGGARWLPLKRRVILEVVQNSLGIKRLENWSYSFFDLEDDEEDEPVAYDKGVDSE